jgi:phosphoribosylformimino-5-aminoimidazole carboxamide ribotide isomerase
MIQIIPAIDLIGGKCVRLTQGDYAQKKIYDHDPLELAKMFESIGIKRLHLVDLDGAREKKLMNIPVLESISKNTSLVIDWGGGITTQQDMDNVFNAGAAITVIGSLAVSNPETVANWIDLFGAAKVIIGADVIDRYIAVNAWQDKSDQAVDDFIRAWVAKGALTFLCTDVAKDGMLMGSTIELYRFLRKEVPSAHLIASGGVSSIEEIMELERMGMDAAIIGKALYEGKLKISELSIFI